jgi:transcriptional antiterminator NusG
MPVVMSDDNATPADAPAPEPPAAPEPVAALPGPEEHAALPAPADESPVQEEVAEAAAEEPAPEVAEEEVAAAEPEPATEEISAEEPEPATVAESLAEEGADADTAAEPAAAAPALAVADSPKKWYVVKVQSGREESIKAAVERKVKIEGLEEFFGQINIPVEEFVEKKKVSVKDKKTGQKVTQEKNVVKKRKKFPGYLFAEVEFNDRILYLFRETSGVGDFVGATHHRAPAPMPESEVRTMLTGVAGPGTGAKKAVVKLDFEKGDKVRVKDGAFAGSEAEVKAITMPKDPTDTPKVTVVVTIWGRPVEMEMDYWHVDKV